MFVRKACVSQNQHMAPCDCVDGCIIIVREEYMCNVCVNLPSSSVCFDLPWLSECITTLTVHPTTEYMGYVTISTLLEEGEFSSRMLDKCLVKWITHSYILIPPARFKFCFIMLEQSFFHKQGLKIVTSSLHL